MATYSQTDRAMGVETSLGAEALLRTAATVTLKLGDGGERTLHGLISRFTQLGRVEGLTAYEAEIVPWLWFLGLSTE